MKSSLPIKMRLRIGIWAGVVLALVVQLPLAIPAEGDAESPIAVAERMLLEGKHAEAEEAFAALAKEQPVPAALGLARVQEATGRRDAATATLSTAAKAHAEDARLPAESARLALARGDYQSAQQLAASALKLDKDQPLAVWVRAEAHTVLGQFPQADAGYQHLVKLFNAGNVTDPRSLRWIGLGAAQYARWNRLSDQFGFLVNEFYPDLLVAEPACWQAHYEAGRLYAEKYNTADAGKELKAALAKNANAAEVHVALGELTLEEFELSAAQAACDRALEINAEYLPAWHLKADIRLANFEPRECVGILTDALKLHPTSEQTLGRMAAAYVAIDGLGAADDTRFARLLAEVSKRNPKPGVFYESLADALDRLRRWPAAATYYQEAIRQMPQLIAPRGQLGMMFMRLGEEQQAKEVLDEAFKIDPFNVRVNNTLKVLEVLDGYETLETEHFRIKFNPATDKLVARYMGQWLEEVYPDLVRQMGFAPPEKSLFEVFSKAKNTDGHGWFSARMVGLPHIHPIGACAGKIVALQSPAEGEQRFNWARVLKHEFIHVINLQQTRFNIPHWFTEAVAVLNEGYPRPQSWNDVLAAHAAANKLFNLDTINFGFIRPHSSDEWTLAYCQAELYAEYMLERFGDDAIAKMLSAYADNLTTPEALARSFNVPARDFEEGYRAHVAKILAALPSAAKAEMSLVDVQKGLIKNPRDPLLLAHMAQFQLGRKNYPEARRLADAALAIEPRSALAHYVRARLHLLVGENAQALERLEGALVRDNPQENVLALLAGLKLKSEDYTAAADLYQLGVKHEPHSAKWLKALAAVYLKSAQNEELADVLAKLAAIDADDLPIRKKLAQMAVAKRDWPAAARWSLEGLYIQVVDVDLHRYRAEALVGLGDPRAAVDEFEAAVELDPEQLTLRLALAETLVKANEPAKARLALEELLKLDTGHAAARQLLETIK